VYRALAFLGLSQQPLPDAQPCRRKKCDIRDVQNSRFCDKATFPFESPIGSFGRTQSRTEIGKGWPGARARRVRNAFLACRSFAGAIVDCYPPAMVATRLFVPFVLIAMAGCSPDPAIRQKVTGSDVAVAGWPRQPIEGRFLIKRCCTLRLVPGTRPTTGQGVDSILHDVTGPGYVIRIVFGPFDSGEPMAGYRLAGKRFIDGVELNSFRWLDRTRSPPEGRLLWLGQVGGKIIDGVEHTPWGLRLSAECTTAAACDASAALIRTIRF
jgi:hypothetical protein